MYISRSDDHPTQHLLSVSGVDHFLDLERTAVSSEIFFPLKKPPARESARFTSLMPRGALLVYLRPFGRRIGSENLMFGLLAASAIRKNGMTYLRVLREKSQPILN